jgi:hypothetical protein
MWTCHVDILLSHQPWCAFRGQKKKNFILQGAILKKKICKGVLQNSLILQGGNNYLTHDFIDIGSIKTKKM